MAGEPARRFIAIAGRRLEFDLIAAPSAGRPTLIFLHQGLGSLSMWRDVPHRLAERTETAALVYSRLGYGWSDPAPERWPDDFMLREGRETLPALLAALGIKDVILVGHSDGATIALAYLAAGHAARGAVAVAPHVFDEAITYEAIACQRADWETGALRRRLKRHHRDTDRMFASWSGIWLAPQFRNWSIVPSLAAIRAPLLVIQGAEDSHGTMRQMEAIAAHCAGPVEVQTLTPCGHDPFRDRSEETLALLQCFIARLAPPGTR